MKKFVVLGLYISDNMKESFKVQEVLTKFGCSIKTRLGLHNIEDDCLKSNGLILLELTGDPDEMQKLEKELFKIEGLKVQKMSF